MSASCWTMLGCLAAVVLTVLAESRGLGHSERTTAIPMRAALLCFCGVCAGLVSARLDHFLRISEWPVEGAAEVPGHLQHGRVSGERR